MKPFEKMNLQKSREELIKALQKAIKMGLKISVDGMTSDEAANYVLDVLEFHKCLERK